MKKLLNRILIKLGLRQSNPTNVLIKRDITDQIVRLNPGGAMFMSLVKDNFDKIEKSPSIDFRNVNKAQNGLVCYDEPKSEVAKMAEKRLTPFSSGYQTIALSTPEGPNFLKDFK